MSGDTGSASCLRWMHAQGGSQSGRLRSGLSERSSFCTPGRPGLRAQP